MVGSFRSALKVSGLNSELERQTNELEGLYICKEQAKIEIALKNESLNQKASIQFQFHKKSEELEKSTLESFRLKEKNMALAKELATLKLVTDLDIDEEEVLKLATFGNGANSKDTVDTLKKSLVMRNRSYKELMAKCNVLGRGEARYSKKLDKAKEKIAKLKRDYITIDEDDLEGTNALQGCSQQNYKDRDRDNIAFSKPSLAKLGTMSTTKTETLLQGKCTLAESPRVDIDIDISNILAGPMDEDVLYKPPLNINNLCGLLGPDETHQFLGKWCKRGQNSESSSAKRSSNGDLIAVGADGRGGRIKVLRTTTQILSESFL
ncbi:unnamed protein product [Sphenostylis stenocarpa]|uniref:Uncharacterized protein n=1 Tax=Sphenostylis stenocarpa TaxID=92480 RepID=A0AA86SZC4_9FABA|nr:unnamed protein product [Sphenostylis stenocarpa]